MTLSLEAIAAAIIKAEDEAPTLGQILEPGEAVTFRVAGVQGDTGPIGPKGNPGKDGRDGIDGLPGTDGDTGLQGPPGTDGIPGLEGPQGIPGERGLKGDKGDTGEPGPEGKRGAQGPAGSVISMRRSGGGGGGGSGSTVNLSDAVPLVESGAGAAGAAGAASRGDHVHPAGPGGGGAVDSVNGETGVVVLDAADVGALPIADPTNATIDTTTYDDVIEGVGKFTTVVFPAGPTNNALLAVAKEGDAFPRIIMSGNPLEGTYVGDGTVNPVNAGTASWIEGPDVNGWFSYVFEGGGAHQTRFADFEANRGYTVTLAGMGVTVEADPPSGANINISAVAGAPVIGGEVGDIAIRSDPSGTNDLIYRCTVAGIAGAATWVAQALGGLAGSAQTYTESNVTTDRAFNANATSIDELADVLGTLIADLRNRGVVN